MIQINKAITLLKVNGLLSAKSTPSLPSDKPKFMFTEDQITKQLTDMREQTEFMQKFRVALALALREIKTLRSCPATETVRNTDSKSNTRPNVIADPTFDPLNLLPEGTKTPNMEGPCREQESLVNSTKRHNRNESHACVCSQLRPEDYEFLHDFLVKIKSNGIGTETTENLDALKLIEKSPKCKEIQGLDFENCKKAGLELDDCIRRIERLKSNLADRKLKTEIMSKDLFKSQAIRVKREAKLEQKLNELADWKSKYESLKALNEKERKISRGLRVALSSERKRVKSSEKLAGNLEETRKAFFQLKNQAGELMNTLKSKDAEIAELNSKLEAFSSERSNVSSQSVEFTSIHGVVPPASSQIAPSMEKRESASQTDEFFCERCSFITQENRNDKTKSYSFTQDLGDINSKSSSNDFSQHFYTAPSYSIGDNHHSNKYQSRDDAKAHHKDPPKEQFRASSHGHPYGRRIYPAYTSPESYRRVSRPPLRRRLHFDGNPHHNRGHHSHRHGSHMLQNVSVNTLLSPIDENDESNDDVTSKQSSPTKPTGAKDFSSDLANSRQIPTVPQMTSPQRLHHDHFQSRVQWPQPQHVTPRPNTFPFHVHDSIFENETQNRNTLLNKKLPPVHNNQSRNNNLGDAMTQSLTLSVNEEDIPKPRQIPKESTSPEKSPKSAYLEVGGSPSPSNSRNSSVDTSESGSDVSPPQLLPNSFIRQKPTPDRDVNCKTLETGASELTPDFRPTERLEPLQFGVSWHPAMKQADGFTEKNSGTQKTTSSGHLVNAHSPISRANTSPSPRKGDFTKHKSKKITESGRFVTYKGHKIDVTKFSIHAFRDIIWTLEGGTESAEDFINFLASLATKLNENPKWKERHALGDAKDWLELRGLY